jgi:D-threo-aldose 1-dehydrogenase
VGIRFFDTAPQYGYGLAERRLGLGLERRQGFRVATKVGFLLLGHPSETGDEDVWRGVTETGMVCDFSPDGVRTSLETSLDRLGLEEVDIVHIHDPDSHWDEASGGAFDALQELKDAGRIHAIGVGMNQWEMLARFVEEVEIDCVLLAGRYTLLDQSALDRLLPLCVAKNVSVVIGGVFNSGILADPDQAPMFNYRPASEQVRTRVSQLRHVCDVHGVPLKAVALQFPAAHPAVASVLLGCRSADEVRENIELLQLPIPPELWEDLRANGLVASRAPLPGDADG